MLKLKLNLLLIAASLLGAAAVSSGQTVVPATAEQEAKLIAVLKSDAPQKDKADACRLLALIGTKNAIPVLAELLGDEQLSHMARYALEPIPEPAVDEALRAALGVVEGRPLLGVIASLGVRRDFKAVEPLAELLARSDAAVGKAAARALGDIGTPTAAEALTRVLAKAPAAIRLDVMEGLFRCAERLLAQGQQASAAAIYDRLREVKDAPHQVRGGALRGAIFARQQAGVPLLQEYLRSRDYILFSAAVQVAQEIPGLEITQTLAGELGKLPTDHAILVTQTLGLRGDAAAVPALAAAAKQGDPAVRQAAIKALPMIGHASAAPALVELAGDADRDVAKTALDSLAAIPGKEVDTAILAMLQHRDQSKRLAGIELIERRGMTTALPALFKATGDSDAEVRAAAFRRVGTLGSPAEAARLIESVLRLNNAQDLDAAEQALSALCAKAENPGACAAQLTPALSQAQAAQKPAFLRVLSTVGGPQALAAVRAAVADGNGDIRSAAIRALGAWKTADAAPDLLQLAKTSTDATVKTLCLRSYLRLIGNQDIPANQRLDMCRQAAGLIQSDQEKKQLLSALGGIASPQAFELITPYLDNAATKEEASAAIVGIADKLLNRKDADKLAARLIAPLEKAAQATANADTANRAKAMAQQARNKAGQK